MDEKIDDLFNKWFDVWDVWIETASIPFGRYSFRQAFEAGYKAGIEAEKLRTAKLYEILSKDKYGGRDANSR